MMKHFFVCLMMSLALSATAQQQGTLPDDLVVVGDKIAEVESLLKSVKGYVFLEKDQTRDLARTFNRTDKVLEGADTDALKGMSWTTQNEDIASVNDYGVITGNKYGQTLLTLFEGEEGSENVTPHYFIVFVCPTVTVISPDGVVYKHQKVYNEKMKVDFSQSDNYVINSIMATYGGQSYDVTDRLNHDGHYESSSDEGDDIRITNDVVYTITLEKEGDDIVLSRSPYRFMVAGQSIKLKSTDKNVVLDDSRLNKLKLAVTTMKNVNGRNQEVSVLGQSQIKDYGGASDEEGVLTLNIPFNEGIYNLMLTDEETGKAYTYKVIIKF